jgi:hypothetical protein
VPHLLKRGHFRFNIAAIIGFEEIMRRIYGPPPYFHYSLPI